MSENLISVREDSSGRPLRHSGYEKGSKLSGRGPRGYGFYGHLPSASGIRGSYDLPPRGSEDGERNPAGDRSNSRNIQ